MNTLRRVQSKMTIHTDTYAVSFSVDMQNINLVQGNKESACKTSSHIVTGAWRLESVLSGPRHTQTLGIPNQLFPGSHCYSIILLVLLSPLFHLWRSSLPLQHSFFWPFFFSHFLCISKLLTLRKRFPASFHVLFTRASIRCVCIVYTYTTAWM